jgi:hypothetical protein
MRAALANDSIFLCAAALLDAVVSRHRKSLQRRTAVHLHTQIRPLLKKSSRCSHNNYGSICSRIDGRTLSVSAGVSAT